MDLEEAFILQWDRLHQIRSIKEKEIHSTKKEYLVSFKPFGSSFVKVHSAPFASSAP
jgi:hypothetical protein